MSCKKYFKKPNLQSLPEDLFIDIASRLNGSNLCDLELVSKTFQGQLTKPSRPWPRSIERPLNLSRLVWKAPNPKASRSYIKLISSP